MEKRTPRILFIDYCNFEDYQIGGHLSWAKNMLTAFGNNLALVGITTNKNDITGKWIKKTISGITYDYFALRFYKKSKTKHFIPDRLACYFLLKIYKKRIQTIKIDNVFIQRHEILPAIINFGYKNICYRFPGMESPLAISKYWFGKYFAEQFDRFFFNALSKVNFILASGDEEAITGMIAKSNGLICRDAVLKFPTRINTDIFRPSDYNSARSSLNIPVNEIVIVTSGRLAQLKGWKFLIDCFGLFQKEKPQSSFYLIGEGEDHDSILNYVKEKNLDRKVILTGEKTSYELADYLNASNLFIMGSYKEGWSTSLSEAVATGVPACVTNFSSAKEIIKQGENGYVVDDHREDIFVRNMLMALELPRPLKIEETELFSAGRLKDDILKYWKLK